MTHWDDLLSHWRKSGLGAGMNGAARVMGHVLCWGVDCCLIDRYPFPTGRPIKAKPRDRVLEIDEVRTVWKWSDTLCDARRDVFRMLILTACRRNEITALEWSEVGADRLEILGDRMKSVRPHVVPLSHAARIVP